MKKLFMPVMVSFLIGVIAGSIISKRSSFLDSNGNVIPDEVVELYSKSHFVILDSSEYEMIDRYYWPD